MDEKCRGMIHGSLEIIKALAIFWSYNVEHTNVKTQLLFGLCFDKASYSAITNYDYKNKCR